MQYVNEEDKNLLEEDTLSWKFTLVIGVLLIFDLLVRSRSIVSIEFGVLILLILLFQPINSKIQIMFFLLPFTSVLVMGGEYSIVSIVQMVMVLSLLIKCNSVNIKQIFLLVVFFALQLFTVIIYEAEIVFTITTMVFLLLFSLLTEMFRTSKQDLFPAFAKSLVFGIIVASSISIIPNFKYLVMYGYIGRFAGLWGNANIYGMQLLIGIALVTSLLFEKSISKLFGGVLLVILCFFLVMTYSRTAIFGLSLIIIISLIMYLTEKNTSNKFLKNMVAIIIFIIVFNLAFIFVVEPIISRRGIVSSDDDITAGRFTIAIHNITWIVQEKKGLPLLSGLGIHNNLDYMERNGYTTSGTHNTYLEMLISSGLFGFLAWALFLSMSAGKAVFTAIKSRRLYVYVVVLYTFTAHLHATSFVYMALTLVSLNYSDRNNKQTLTTD